MKEIVYRSIFPNNNIPKPEIRSLAKDLSHKNELTCEVNSLINYADFSKVSSAFSKIEFEEKLKNDPVGIFLEKLQEKSIM
ncbi:hypothetical protein IAI10_11230 [Clostridium sp. 19966]|uniref:hypothetical protein n=1 Tax=Clostridium sp. 19966 TaxID=2768166 RepID=UPI0028DF2C3B|nr:hypothetical protein [Clostridium sp. 19966]MDT8717230.1 hypothetical protein [Clostridium sp. 19966]